MGILLNINTALTTTLHNDMLLIKEYLYIPSMTVQVEYFQGSDFKGIGYKVHNSVIVRVINADKSHTFGIQLARIISCYP